MEYNLKSKEIETSIKLTAHDLEKEISSIYKVDLNFEIQSDTTEQILENYLREHLKIIQKGRKLNLVVVGYEYDLSGDLYIFAKFEKFKFKKEFKLENKVLFFNFPQQQNITSFKVGERQYQKTLVLKKSTMFSNDI
jgi:hypothetical protein